MKQISFLLSSLILLSVLHSCKGDGNYDKAPINGSINEIMVIMDRERWNGPCGDSIKAYFGQDKFGLPQAEPVFDLVSLPASNLSKHIKQHRNLFITHISPSVDSAQIVFMDSPWSISQKVYKISAPDNEEFLSIFSKYKETMMNTFLVAERNRIAAINRKSADEKIFNHMRDKYKVKLYCPKGYKLNKDADDNFVWISYETAHYSRGIIFMQEQYESEDQLNHHIILDQFNLALQKHIPGPLDSTWMNIDPQQPMLVNQYNYNKKYYSIMLKGLWHVENDFMGGPFILNTVLDTGANRIIYMFGYIYAPEDKKRNMTSQVEAIVSSFKINYDEETAK